MSAADRLVRENLVNSLVAGVATGMGTSGADMATAAGAAQIESQNNQVAPFGRHARTDEQTLTGDSGTPKKWYEQSPVDLLAQGIKNGLDAFPGFGEGGPVGPSMATALATVESWLVPTSATLSQPGYVPSNATLAKGDKGTQASSTDSGGAPPPNMSPDGAGRSGAFNEAKRNAGIPTSQQPVEVRPNVDRQGNVQPGYQYVYEVPSEGGRTKEVIIRDDAGGHSFGNNDPQNRGAHFNDPAGNHYDY
ncbi:hypothetical protein AWB82_07235 [Caballeronia glebae]|uniref:HNH/Endo VII superfamily nuclease toxins domain-containing protein n=2 Tax=Caballeronia glebae TaxID=1777143 RepID=A0A158DVT1_9BURK|nr:hypothetical protein AWB82_07235 [Caballeronia glebae]